MFESLILTLWRPPALISATFQGVQIRCICHFKECKFELSKSKARSKEKSEHIAIHIAAKQYHGTYNSTHEQCGACGSTSPYCKVAVRWKRNYSDCGSGMAPLKPTLKRLVGWANGLTECFVCHKYYWLLNTKDHYKNQHPGQQVPEVNEGTVQGLPKKLIKDQTTKKRTVRRIERTQKRKGRGTPRVLMKSSSHISIPRRTKKGSPLLMKVKLAHEHPYSEKTKREKTYPPRSDSREGRDPEGPRELKNTLYLKAMEGGSSVFRLKACTGCTSTVRFLNPGPRARLVYYWLVVDQYPR